MRNLFGFLALSLVACASPAHVAAPTEEQSQTGPIAWVQTKNGGTFATCATFDAAQRAGDLNVVAIGWGDDTSSVASVTDTRGNVYVLAAPLVTIAGSPPLRQAIYYAKNIAAGSNTISVSFNGTPYYPDLRVVEYAGVDPTAPFDVTASATGANAASTTIASASVTTSAANALVFGAGMTTDIFAGAGPSFTQRIITSDGNLAEDRLTSTAGSYNASAVISGANQTWIMQLVAFKAATGSVCVPTTCAAQGDNCGSIADGCGGTLSCGSCTAPATCGGAGNANVCGTSTLRTNYSTNFPLSENPILDDGNWINGGAVGLDWTNVSTTPGLAIGHQVAASFSDATALLTGTWAADQTATATVHTVNQNDQCYQEVELRLRSAMSAHVNTGYEISFHMSQTTAAYLIIVRWNGALGDFTVLLANVSSQFAIKDGDVISASIVGNVITAFRNGIQMGQATDNTFTSGSPGIGFNLENGSAGCPGTNGDYGYTHYSVTAQ